MNGEVRVMLCDDSALMRRLIRTAIDSEASLSVVCEAKDGQDALDKLGEAKPDIIVMDIEMPVMDGVQAVREIRRINRNVPIVMFSSLTSRGAQASFDAIAAGASDFSPKPSGAGHIDQAMDSLKGDLLPKLMFWATRRRIQSGFQGRINRIPAQPESPQRSQNKSREKVGIVAIGVSTGGPQALAKVFSALPHDLPVPVVVAQHMPPVFTGLLAQRLAEQTGHNVREASGGETLDAGHVLIAPGDHHMTVARDGNRFVAKLDRGPPVNSCRPSIDPLFRSVAEFYGRHALGVVLTGMGQDGLRGAMRLHECGARILAQDEATSVVWGMPGEIAKHGLADRVVAIDRIAHEILSALRAGRPRPQATIS